MGKTHNKIQKRPRVVHRSPKCTVAQQQICVIQTGGPIRESLSMCSMRNFSKPDLWCLMTCKKRNATAGSVHVLSFWLGADWAAKERRESLSETEKKPSKQPVPRFFWKDLSATNFRKTNQYSPPIKYRKNFSPFFDVENKSRTSATTSWTFGRQGFVLRAFHTAITKNGCELILMNFDRQQKIHASTTSLFQQFSTKKPMIF